MGWLDHLTATSGETREAARADLLADWLTWAADVQLPPPGDWSVWLLLGGRGSGKTRAGAEWVRTLVEGGLASRIALVGPTLGDVREVMIEGPSGLCSIGRADRRPRYEPSRRRLVWSEPAAEAFVFSAEDPESLRGPQFDAAWCDEIAAWTRGRSTWDILQFGLRLGRRPRIVATTTPSQNELVRRLFDTAKLRPERIAVTRAPTSGNADNLAPGFIEQLQLAYGGSPLARRELDGEMIEEVAGALWTASTLDESRTTRAQSYVRIVVGLDPPAGTTGDACGVVAAGRTATGEVHVLEDASASGLLPMDWAARAVGLARRLGAGAIVAESNQGGAMVRTMLEFAGADSVPVAIRPVHATESKWARAAPVAAWFIQGRARLAGVFPDLEAEMSSFTGEGPASPDRLDAMVWAVRELMSTPVTPRIVAL